MIVTLEVGADRVKSWLLAWKIPLTWIQAAGLVKAGATACETMMASNVVDPLAARFQPDRATCFKLHGGAAAEGATTGRDYRVHGLLRGAALVTRDQEILKF